MRVQLLEIDKAYGPVQANQGVSLTVESGRIHGLLGENGAGKTTLMKVLSGYTQPDAGRILLDGREVRLASPADAIAQGIGMLHQDPLDVPALSVLDNFCLGRRARLFQRHGRRWTTSRPFRRGSALRWTPMRPSGPSPSASASSWSSYGFCPSRPHHHPRRAHHRHLGPQRR